MTTESPRVRVPIAERREQIIAAALREFSHKGLHGGSTMAIATQVGISQPNIFRIYPTKKQLFIAVLERVFTNISTTMLAAGEQDAEHPLETMSTAWGELMTERENMFMLLQGYAAAADDDIRELMSNWTRDVFERMEALPVVGTDNAHDFFAAGMLYMVAAAMDLPSQAADSAWAARFLESGS